MLNGKSVLITGGTGTFGKAFAKIILAKYPEVERVIIFSRDEFKQFEMSKLQEFENHPKMRYFVGDVRDRERLFRAFEDVDIVIHAAALKQIPSCEYNPFEAVKTNIHGAENIIDAAIDVGVKKVVALSTDKAVNPTNIMGASKRAAECYIQAVAARSKTKFTTVRFGNVLGSNGSVIPIFMEQIKNGGPVTVTDPKVGRYFMTIPEASQLVLQAACLGQSGEIFVLDMGEPMPILELAEELIRLSGLEPYEDIEIAFTGLRPGEKLFEELLNNGENTLTTSHDKIKVLDAVGSCAVISAHDLDQLFSTANSNDIVGLLSAIQRLVPEYTPTYHFSGNPPAAFCRMRPDMQIRE